MLLFLLRLHSDKSDRLARTISCQEFTTNFRPLRSNDRSKLPDRLQLKREGSTLIFLSFEKYSSVEGPHVPCQAYHSHLAENSKTRRHSRQPCDQNQVSSEESISFLTTRLNKFSSVFKFFNKD